MQYCECAHCRSSGGTQVDLEGNGAAASDRSIGAFHDHHIRYHRSRVSQWCLSQRLQASRHRYEKTVYHILATDNLYKYKQNNRLSKIKNSKNHKKVI